MDINKDFWLQTEIRHYEESLQGTYQDELNFWDFSDEADDHLVC